MDGAIKRGADGYYHPTSEEQLQQLVQLALGSYFSGEASRHAPPDSTAFADPHHAAFPRP